VDSCRRAGAGTNPFDYLTELQRHSEELKRNPPEWVPGTIAKRWFGAKPAAA